MRRVKLDTRGPDPGHFPGAPAIYTGMEAAADTSVRCLDQNEEQEDDRPGGLELHIGTPAAPVRDMTEFFMMCAETKQEVRSAPGTRPPRRHSPPQFKAAVHDGKTSGDAPTQNPADEPACSAPPAADKRAPAKTVDKTRSAAMRTPAHTKRAVGRKQPSSPEGSTVSRSSPKYPTIDPTRRVLQIDHNGRTLRTERDGPTLRNERAKNIVRSKGGHRGIREPPGRPHDASAARPDTAPPVYTTTARSDEAAAVHLAEAIPAGNAEQLAADPQIHHAYGHHAALPCEAAALPAVPAEKKEPYGTGIPAAPREYRSSESGRPGRVRQEPLRKQESRPLQSAVTLRDTEVIHTPRDLVSRTVRGEDLQQKDDIGSFSTMNEHETCNTVRARAQNIVRFVSRLHPPAAAQDSRDAYSVPGTAPYSEPARHICRHFACILIAGVVLAAAALIIGMAAAFSGAAAGSAEMSGGAAYLDTSVVLELKSRITAEWLDHLREAKKSLGDMLVTVRYNPTDEGDGDAQERLDNWNDVLAVWLAVNGRCLTLEDYDSLRDVYFSLNPVEISRPDVIDVRNLRAPDAVPVFGLSATQILKIQEWISPLSDQSAFWRELVGATAALGADFAVNYLNVPPGSAAQIVLQEAQARSGWIYSQERRTQPGYADCSSLAYMCYRSIGLEPGGPWATAAEMGRWCDTRSCRVPSEQRAPGDLIFWGGRSNGRYLGIYHVAIYAGDGMMWEASPSAGGVVYRAVSAQNPSAIIFYARPAMTAECSWSSDSIPADAARGIPYVMSTTAYCEACDTIYGDGRTASGTYPKRGTVAVSRTRQFPFGTRLYIPGYGYGIVEDTGGFGDGTIDLYMGHASVCSCGSVWGRRTLTVYVLQ